MEPIAKEKTGAPIGAPGEYDRIDLSALER